MPLYRFAVSYAHLPQRSKRAQYYETTFVVSALTYESARETVEDAFRVDFVDSILGAIRPEGSAFNPSAMTIGTPRRIAAIPCRTCYQQTCVCD